MDITVCTLTPDLAEDYVRFFDVTPHDVNVDEEKCYCVTWRDDASYAANGNHWFPTREERRSRALQFVRDGHLQGYLAYQGEEIVGWCNANANCQACRDYLRAFWPMEDNRPDVRIKSVFCFMIAPKVQRTGVATRLLEQVCRDAGEEGFDFVEAYAYDKFDAVPHDFRGPLTMYEQCGFTVFARREDKVVVRKALKGKADAACE